MVIPNVKSEDKKENPSASSGPSEEEKADVKKNYYYAVGRRKRSTATARVFTNGKGSFLINDKDYKKYFPYFEHQQTLEDAFTKVGQEGKMDITVKVKGGGARGQAEAIRLAISRALEKLNPNYRKPLKKSGYLRRDPRKKERKKYGLKKARRAPQWQKR